MEGGALLNNISVIQKSMIGDLALANEFSTPVKNIAAAHLKPKLEWLSQQERDGIKDYSFRADHIYLLVLACYFITDVRDNLKSPY